MSLDNIELGDLIVSELYRDTLLATEAAPAAARPRAATSIPVAPPPSVPEPEAKLPAGPTIPTDPGPDANSPASTVAAPNIPTAAVPAGYKFLGNNRRGVTILVSSPGVAFLPDDQLSFLSRMLEACKMNMGDVAIVNLATADVNITALKQQLQPAVILLFGMEPVTIRLPMNFPWFKIQAYDDCTYLCAPSLEELVQPGDENKLSKSKLWMCLKTLFSI